MAQYVVNLSDGSRVTVEADSEPTAEEVSSALSQQVQQPAVKPNLLPSSPSLSISPDALQQMQLATNARDPRNENFENYSARNPTDTTLLLKKLAPTIKTPEQQEQFGRLVADKTAGDLPVSSVGGDAWEALWTPPKPIKEWVETERGIDKDIADTDKQLRAKAIKAGFNPDDFAKDPSIASQVTEGAGNAILDLALTFTSPGGLATLGMGALPKALQKTASIAFGAQMLSQTPEIASQLLEEIRKPADQRDYRKIAQLTVSGIANTGFSAAAFSHGLSAKPNASSELTTRNGSDNVSESGKSNTDQNQLQGGAQGQPVNAGEVASGNVSPDASKVLQASSDWNEAVQKGDKDAQLNAEAELSGTPMGRKELERITLLYNSDHAGSTLRASGGNGEEVGSEAASAGARSPQESQQSGQSPIQPPTGDTGATQSDSSQPEVKPHDLVPALQTKDGIIIGKPGETHAQIKERVVADPNISDTVKGDVVEAFIDDGSHVFSDRQGQVLDRDQASEALGEKEPLQSERLKELQKTPAVPDKTWQVSVQSPFPGIPDSGYVQVDDVSGGENKWSSSPDSLKASGYDLPATSEFQRLPQGKYTMEEALKRLETKAARPSELTDEQKAKSKAANDEMAKNFAAQLKPTSSEPAPQYTTTEVIPPSPEAKAPAGDGASTDLDIQGVTPLDPSSGTPLSGLESFINRTEAKKPGLLERADARLADLQGKLRSGKNSFTGITGLEPVALDLALTAARTAIKVTGSVVEGVKAAIEHIKTNYPDAKYNPDDLTKWITDNVREATGAPEESDGDATGLAERVRKEREATGKIEPTVPGEGIDPEVSVENGRQRLQAGENPEKVMGDFEATGKFSEKDLELVRAQTEKLARETNQAEENHGTESEEFKKASQAESDWSQRSKKMQTAWARSGHVQQGEVDIDTGTFSGLRRAFKESTDKDFTPAQAETAKRKAKKVKDAKAEDASAKQELFDKLDSEFGGTDAEKRALQAAHDRVRDIASQLADAENKRRIAKTVQAREVQKIQEKAARKALEAAQKVVRDAASRLAEAENRQRVKDAIRPENVQEKAAKAALDAANKTVRDAAARLADAENKSRVAKAARDKLNAEKERKAAQRILDEAHRRARNAASAAAKAEVKARIARADTAKFIWGKAKEYLLKGVTDFGELTNKLATDLGMSVEKIRRELARPKGAKRLTDEMWKKQQMARRLDQQAKRWLRETTTPLYRRALEAVPATLFGLKVGFHGTVALGTHAPFVAFQPRFWKAYIHDFGKMYRMVGSRAYYESQVQDLLRRPNYTTARRAGLVNDPYTGEDFNSPDVAKYLTGLTQMGNRGYTVLKILRQDMFDQHWNNLPKTARIPEVAKAIADGVNHATGVVKVNAPKGANVALFAPRLEMSRIAWLAADPLKAAGTFLNWKNASEGEKVFAINQIKEKAWVLGTLYGLLALNQGMLSATGSKQKVNMTDPMKSDWMKFKVAGMDVSYGNALLSMARLPVRLWAIRNGSGGKTRGLIYPDEDTYTVLGQYFRSQMSPFASLATDLWMKGDWENRPLPNSKRPVPARLRAQGVKPYTWPEFWSEQLLPIPAEEAVKEVWKNGLGMNPEQVSSMRKALATIAVMAATGARLTDDVQPKTVKHDYSE